MAHRQLRGKPMLMRRSIIVIVAAVLSLQGCLFIYLPGTTVAAVSDAFTGAKGENCVSEAAKVGDTVTFPNGATGTIKSISGNSTRCTNSDRPIRAEVARN
jgi:hypothetical protein